MARLFSNHPFENEREAEAVKFLQTHLPDEYILINNIQLAHSQHVPEMDLLIIKEKALLVVELKDWYGDISGNPQAGTLLVGPRQEQRKNPISQVHKQAKALAFYLREEANAAYIFGDYRIASSLYVTPLVIFTHPEANLKVESPANVKLMRLDEAVTQLTDAALDNPRCLVKRDEQMRLVELLLNERQPVEQDKPSAIPEPVAPLPVPLTAPPAPEPLPAPEPAAAMPPIVFEPAPSPKPDPAVNPPVPTQSLPQRSGWNTLRQLGRMLTAVPEKVENKVQGMVENPGAEQRLTRNQMIRQLERKMEQNLYHFSQATIAPNYYLVGMASSDYEHYLVVQERLCEDLTSHLREVMRTRDYRLEGELLIEMSEMPALASGHCQVVAHIESGTQTGPSGVFLELLGGAQQKYNITKSVTTIGRAQENDVCLGAFDNKRIVSRYHAQLKLENGQYWLYDLKSSQGTYVNGTRLQEQGQALQSGDTIILGPTQRKNGLRPLDGSLAFVFRM